MSVSLPSSNICSNILNTSSWAFSISSNKITEYGFLLTFSVKNPAWSKPTYPGGAPISFDTVCFSIYSDISSLIIASSFSNSSKAKVLASSVFPTPVGPTNINEDGFFFFLNPERFLLMALARLVTAGCCPTTLLCSLSSKCINLSASSSLIFCTGILVQASITYAISSSVNSIFSYSLDSSFNFDSILISVTLSSAAFS